MESHAEARTRVLTLNSRAPSEVQVGRDDVADLAGAVGAGRVVLSALVLTLVVAAYGILARRVLDQSGLARPIGKNIYYRLYVLHELPYLILLAMFVGATLLVVIARRSAAPRAEDRSLVLPPPGARSVAVIALVVLMAGVAIDQLVMHHLLFSMDEFSADFQARVFARGEFSSVVPWPWRSLKDAITPIFVQFHEDSGRWVSQYLPVYSLIKAGFVRINADVILNPLLSAGCVVALAGVARRLWPDEGLRPWLAV